MSGSMPSGPGGSQDHRALKLVAMAFFLAYFVIGLLVFRDYGVSWDEPIEKTSGLVASKYVLKTLHLHDAICPKGCESDDAQEFGEYRERAYGVWFQLAAAAIGGLFGVSDYYDEILLRHFLCFLVFFLGCTFLYRSIMLLFRDRLIALLCTLLFVSQPRFFAEQFYNGKDILFLAVVLIASYYALVFLKRETIGSGVAAGLASGLAIATRVMGALVPVEVLVILLLDRIARREGNSRIRESLLAYVLATIVSAVALWPYLWANPLTNFGSAFQRMSQFDWYGVVLFNGAPFRASNLPWYYLPEWIAITTPELIVLLLVGAVALFIWRLVRDETFSQKHMSLRLEMYYFGMLIIPLLAVIFFHSTVYDGWRHVYFVMAGGFIAVAWLIHQVKLLAQPKQLRIFSVTLCVFVLAQSMVNVMGIVRNHPYENVYFNSIARQDRRHNYELDYWGLSYRAGLEYILAHDSRDAIKIYLVGDRRQTLFASPSENSRLVYADSNEDPTIDYFLTTYRFHPQDYPFHETYSVFSYGEKIMSVYKMR